MTDLLKEGSCIEGLLYSRWFGTDSDPYGGPRVTVYEDGSVEMQTGDKLIRNSVEGWCSVVPKGKREIAEAFIAYCEGQRIYRSGSDRDTYHYNEGISACIRILEDQL